MEKSSTYIKVRYQMFHISIRVALVAGLWAPSLVSPWLVQSNFPGLKWTNESLGDFHRGRSDFSIVPPERSWLACSLAIREVIVRTTGTGAIPWYIMSAARYKRSSCRR